MLVLVWRPRHHLQKTVECGFRQQAFVKHFYSYMFFLMLLSLRRHDFVVVETIDFYQDEEAELPAPLTLAEVKMLNKAGPFGAEEEAALDDDADAKPDSAEVNYGARIR